MEVIEAGGAEGSKLVRQASTSSMMDDKVRYNTPPPSPCGSYRGVITLDKFSTCLQILLLSFSQEVVVIIYS